MSTSATPRGLLFGTAAESYERFRLGYPDEVVDRTLAYAGRPVGSAVEVGAGTGKATRAFASRGIQVVALEPDTEMYGVLERETAGMPVTPRLSSFEAYDGPPADLVYAAAAWHWTDPTTRWNHAADLLEPGGVLSIFGSQLRIADPDLEQAVGEAIAGDVDDSAFRKGTKGPPGVRLAGRGHRGVGPVRGGGEPRPRPGGDGVPEGVRRSPHDDLCVPAAHHRGAPGRAAAGLRARPGAGAARRVGRAPARTSSLTGQSASSTITGAWSLAPVPARSSRSISAPVTRVAKAAEPSTKSMRIPRLRSKRCR